MGRRQRPAAQHVAVAARLQAAQGGTLGLQGGVHGHVGDLIPVDAAIDQQIVLGVQHLKTAAPQRHAGVPRRRQGADQGQGVLLPAVLIVPGHGAAAVGVGTAGQPDLVAVVQAGGTHIGELEGQGQPVRRVVAAHHADEAGSVVAVEQVHLGLHDLGGVQLRHLQHPPGKGRSIQRLDMPGAAGLVHAVVQGTRPEVGQAGPGEGIVHHRVELVSGQPAPRVAPDLAHDVGVGIDGLHAPPELLPEGVVVDLVGHVQPPAIDTKLHPAFGHPPQELAHRLGTRIELGQRPVAPPRRVVGGPGVVVGRERKRPGVEPVQVGAVLALLQQVAELKEAARGVVEYPVQHHLHAAPVRRVNQLAQRVVAAQHRVHHRVVVGVVAVVAGRLKHRAQVQGIHAQAGDVVQPLRDAQQVAALVAVEAGRLAPGLQVSRLGHAGAAGEAVREDLIEHGVLGPVGRANIHGGKSRR